MITLLCAHSGAPWPGRWCARALGCKSRAGAPHRSNAGAHKSKKPPQQMMLVVGWFLNFRAARLFEDLKLFFKVSIPSRIGLRRYSVCPYGAADPTWEIHRVRVTDTLKYTCVCLFSKYTANTQFQISSKYTPNTLNTLCFQSISKYTKYTSPM